MGFRKQTILILLLTIVASLIGCTNSEKYTLEVQVVHLLDGSPITGATVEILCDERAIVRQALDENASATFQLNPGNYLVRMASGYTGKMEVNVKEDIFITLEVLEVAQ